jgi:hypothetical protein
MTALPGRVLLWTPRVLGIALGVFLGLFALDAFTGRKPRASRNGTIVVSTQYTDPSLARLQISPRHTLPCAMVRQRSEADPRAHGKSGSPPAGFVRMSAT